MTMISNVTDGSILSTTRRQIIPLPCLHPAMKETSSKLLTFRPLHLRILREFLLDEFVSSFFRYFRS